jgi:FliI/YscN family ATPase
LIGERGREVAGFIEDDLGPEGLKRAAVVVSTSDQPALLRLKAAHTALAIAEAARARGQNVVLLMDSVTRFARALREVGLAAGEPPGRQGYPASVFAELPRLFERAGTDHAGSITAFFTVLVAGDDIEEPVADETMGLLDGHIVLSRDLASRGAYPAIDIVRSKSRVMTDIVDASHAAAAAKAVRIVSTYQRNYDKISCNAYERGTDPLVDEAIEKIGAVEAFLNQRRNEPSDFASSVAELRQAVGG